MPIDFQFDDLDLRVEADKGGPVDEAFITTITIRCTRTTACTDSCCTTCMVGPG